MNDELRYQLIDEPRPNVFQRLALPPLVVFLVAQFFHPWGALLVAANALALNGPHRNREMALAAATIAVHFAAIAMLDLAVGWGALPVQYARYVFVTSIGVGLVLLGSAYISQEETFTLRRYLRQNG